MNQKSFFLFMMFFTLILAGCQEKSSKKKSSSSNPLNCSSGNNYYTMPGCGGFCSLVANANTAACTGAGTTTGGNTGAAACSGNDYFYVQGCPGFCAYNPMNPSCLGTTTGGSNGTPNCKAPIAKTCSNYCTTYPNSMGCLPDGTNCWVNKTAAGCPGSSTPLYPNWNKHYPAGEPVGYCSPLITGSGSAPVRQATIINNSVGYNPLTAGNNLNTSSMLMSVATARTFFMTDAALKLRVKVKPQQELTATNAPTYCYGRARGGARIAGYTKLKYTINAYGVSNSNAMTFLRKVGDYETGVNSCTPAIDLSFFKEVSPTGVVIAIEDVQANQNCTSYDNFTYCNSFRPIRSFDCWGVDLEVAADGTQTFN